MKIYEATAATTNNLSFAKNRELLKKMIEDEDAELEDVHELLRTQIQRLEEHKKLMDKLAHDLRSFMNQQKDPTRLGVSATFAMDEFLEYHVDNFY